MTTMLPGLWLPSRFRPGGKSYVHLPVDDMRVPVAGLGAAPLISWRSTFTLRGLGDAAAGPAAPSWCEGLIRSSIVREALSWAGSNPPTEVYKDAVLPNDTKSFRDQNGIAFGLGGASSCGLFVRATWERNGITDPRFTGPYEPHVSFVISDILNFGREHGAYIDYQVDGPQPLPGDVLYFSGAPVGGFEHVSIFVSDNGDGSWTTVDGGQPGVEERIRRVQSNGTLASDGRAVTAFVNVALLPFPCPKVPALLCLAAAGLGAIVGLYLTDKLVGDM